MHPPTASERWAALVVRWRWWIVGLWLLAITASALSLGGLSRLARDDDGAWSSSSAQAHRLLREKLGANALTELGVIYEGVPPPAYRRALDDALAAVPGVDRVRQLPAPPGKGIALDRLGLQANIEDQAAVDLAARLVAALAAHPPPPGVKPHLMGRPVLILELRELNAREVKRVERFSIVLSLVVLVVVFGSLAAALLPLAMGLAGITITLGVLVLLNGAIPVSALTHLVTSVIAIAVGIDYALFIVSRYREERAGGRDPAGALAETLGHTGSAVTLSALVMAVSVTALALPEFTGARSIAGAIAIVLVVTMASSFTFLPALLSLADRWVASDQAQAREHARQRGLWARWSAWVLANHRLVLVGTFTLLAGLVLQLGHLRLWEPGPTLLPESLSSRQGYDALVKAGLAGELDSLFLVIHQRAAAPVLAPDTLAAMRGARAQLLADERVAGVDSVLELDRKHLLLLRQLDTPVGRLLLLPRLKQVLANDASGTYTVMRIVPRQGLASPALRELVVDLHRRLPTHPTGSLDMFLGGNAARRVDFTDAVYDLLPTMATLVVGAVYLLLLAYFRSLLLPLKAVLMNALPVLGACGMLVVVFQYGFGAGLLGVAPAPGAVMAMTPIVVFCLVFGLSMDYEVLILSRVAEAHARGLDDDSAIHAGMSATGGIITGAAVIMLSVFGPNMASAMLNAKELGLGLSTAILLDATVIRLLLVPAFMKAMGRWNWWLPFRRD